MGGDLLKQDGTGNQTIYDDGKLSTIDAEKNDLKFSEPYLLAASANDAGQTGSQFFITLKEKPGLNGSKNTIFGRVLLGEKTVHQIAEVDELKRVKTDFEKIKDKISESSTAENLSLFRKKREYSSENS